MTTTKLITPLTNTILQQRKMLLEVEKFLADNPGLFNYLTIHELVTKVELTPDYLIFHPEGDPLKLATVLADHLDSTFTRSLTDFGAYQWDTIPTGYNFVLRIQANNTIDLTGTPIQ